MTDVPERRASTAGDEGKTAVQITENEQQKDETYLTGLPLAGLLAGLVLVVFLITLDISIVAAAIPRITDEFDTIKDISWYASGYLVAQCALIPLAGRTYAYFSFKVAFISFLAVFEIGSLLCGVARSSTMLIVGRVVCGMGGSGIMNGTMTIIAIVTPPGRKAITMGFFMSLFSLGQIIGPLIGGALTEHASWRWCFYLNLPVGALAVLCFIFVKLPAYPRKPWTARSLFMDLDVPGFMIVAPAVVLLLLALTWGGNEYAWNSATVIGMLCGAVVIIIAFVAWEIGMGQRAMVPPSIVKLRPVATCLVIGFLQGGSMLILSYYLPLFFQAVQGIGPTNSGVNMLPTFLSQVLLSIVTGVVLSKIGLALPPMLLGHSLTAIGYGLFTRLDPSISKAAWIGYQILGGAGRGISLQCPVLVTQAIVPKADLALGTSAFMWSQFMGSAVFVSAAQTVFIERLKTSIGELLPELDAEAVVRNGATAFIASVSADLKPAALEAYSHAIASTNYLGMTLALMALVASFGVWNTRVEIKLPEKKESEESK